MNSKMPKSFVALLIIIGLFVCMFVGVNAAGDGSLTEFFSNQTNEETLSTYYTTNYDVGGVTEPDNLVELARLLESFICELENSEVVLTPQAQKIIDAIDGKILSFYAPGTFPHETTTKTEEIITEPPAESTTIDPTFEELSLFELIHLFDNELKNAQIELTPRLQEIWESIRKTVEEIIKDSYVGEIISAPSSTKQEYITNIGSVSGCCGDNLTWTLDFSARELVISGTGDMYNWNSYNNLAPWSIHSSAIKYITIGEGVTCISDFSFYNCRNFTNIKIPDSVTSIGKWAFVNCHSLTNISIPAGVMSIADDTFFSTNLTYITVDSSNTAYSSDEYGVLFNKNKTELILYPAKNSRTSYEVPNSVKFIKNEAFSYSRNLKTVTIPDSVTSIGRSAFLGCASIINIVIPDSVTAIGNQAFNFCTNLEDITVDSANAAYSSDEYGVLFNKDKTELIQYPAGNKRTNYEIPNSVTSTERYAFHDCIFLTSIEIPDSVTNIGDGSFFGCISLTKITIPDSVTSIGESAFSGCATLTNIVIPDSVTGAINTCFFNCIGLTNVVIGSGVTHIDNLAFNGCTSLTSITIPDGVKIIGYESFSGCTSLESIIIPDSVTSIGTSAFSGCATLTNIVIPDSVTAIGYYAFSRCNSLTDVYYTGTKAEWNLISIEDDNDDLINATIHYMYDEPSFETGDIIEFGSYPQSEVTDNNLIAELNSLTLNWVSYKYYQNMDPYTVSSTSPQDIMEYADVDYNGEKYRAVRINGYRTDSTYHAYSRLFDGYQVKNGYSKETVYWFKYEPLQWEILDPEKGLVVCVSIIDSQPFNNLQEEKDGEYYGDKSHSNYANDYTASSIRMWLNNDFYNAAFSAAEKEKLIATTLDNNGYDSENEKYNYCQSTDNVFMLSFNEMRNEAYGYNSDREVEDKDRMTVGTDYAKCQGLLVQGNMTSEDEPYFGNSYYWLRSAGQEDSFWSCIATYAGTISWAGDVSSTYIGVRPAVTVNLNVVWGRDKVISVYGTSTNIAIGETITLNSNVVSGDVDINNITWSSSDSDIATVKPNGSSAVVTGVSKGKATITATTADGISATFTISVHQQVTGVELNKTSVTIPINSTEQLIATIMPADAANQIIHWYSDDYDIVSIVDGLVTAKSVGTATITVKTDDGGYTASCVITVVQPVTGVKLNSTNLSIIKGKTSQLAVEVLPWDATNKTVTWSSSNSSVATVDANGKITAKSAGTATITVKSNDGGYTAACTVKVINQPVTGVSLNKTSVSVVKGKTYQLTATISPADAYNKSVTWSSSNTSVATVNSSGKVTAKSVGTATITVKTKDGGYTAKCTVTVKTDTISVTGVSLNKTKTTIFVGKTEKLSATVKPSNATNKNITWKSSDTSIATVDSSGKITAVKKGTATITVTTKDGSKTAKCTVTVKPYNENISKTGTFVVGSEKYKQSVTFDANWLNTDSYDYNHNLAKFCSYVSLLTYSSQEEIRTGIENLGFKTFADEETLTKDKRKKVEANNDTVIYWPDKSDTVYDKNCFVITKKDYVMNGENHTVVLVMLRGTCGNEWYSNFDPWGRLAGNTTYNGTHHYYFYEAAMFVKGYLDTYMEKNSLYNNDNVEIIITGHSRGAAVANLLAAEIVGNTDLSPYPVEENIFTYTFATPNVSNNTSRTNSVYNNIFNFVNPEDFVTKCIPAQWGYGRYGITLTLPSKTNESAKSYKTYYNNMNSKFNNYKGRDYQPYTDGEDAVYNVVNKMTSTVPTIKDFYYKDMKNTYATTMTPYEFFRDTLCTIVSETADKDSMKSAALYCYSAALDPVACKTYKQIMKFFVGNEALGILSEIVNKAINSTYFYKKWDVFVDYTFANKYFSDAHCAETYTAFVTSMSYDQAYTWAKDGYRKGYKGTVNCPVDVEVYDKDTGELVGRIVNNVVDEEIAAGENSIVMTVDGDSKSYWLPASGNYEVKLIGNDEGIMNHTVSEIDSDIGEIRRINFVDIPVSKDFEMNSEYSAEDFKIEDVVLVTELGETIGNTELLEEESLQTLSVNVSVEGVGGAIGYDAVTKGDYIILEAKTDKNNSFLGWYENETLVSEESVYGFVVDKDVNLVARFTNVIVDVEKVEFDNSEISLTNEGENSSKLLEINVYPENATSCAVAWKSSNTDVVYVNDIGVVTAVSEGSAIITATIESNGKTITAQCKVNVENNKYEVEWVVGGVSTKENVIVGTVINIPDDPEKEGYTFVGWDKEIPDIMPAEDLVFTAMFESSLTILIRTPSITTIKYGDSIILHADLNEALSAGWKVEWTANNGNFDYSVSADGSTCTITPKKSGDTVFTVTVYDAESNEVSKDEQTMTSKAGFFDKFVAFFKKLFGLTKVIPQAFKGVL